MNESTDSLVRYNAESAFYHAKFIVNGPFPAGEATIAKDPFFAYRYAATILNSPFPAGEPAISNDGYCSMCYARDVLKKPFPAGEPAISQLSIYKAKYDKLFNR